MSEPQDKFIIKLELPVTTTKAHAEDLVRRLNAGDPATQRWLLECIQDTRVGLQPMVAALAVNPVGSKQTEYVTLRDLRNFLAAQGYKNPWQKARNIWRIFAPGPWKPNLGPCVEAVCNYCGSSEAGCTCPEPDDWDPKWQDGHWSISRGSFDLSTGDIARLHHAFREAMTKFVGHLRR